MHFDKSPRISVIMPAYNASRYISKAVQSILNQTFEDFELLISDDGSKDGTIEIINSFDDARIRTFHQQKNQGKTSVVNRLFKLSRGQYVTIHDADDESFPNRFELQLREFEKNSKLVLCGTNFITVDLDEREVGRSNLSKDCLQLKKDLYVNSQFHGPTVLFKTDFVERLNQVYHPFFKDYNEDYDLCFRISEQGDVMNCSDYLYKYRLTPNSLSRKLTIQKRVSVKLVLLLANQRKQTGTDYLLDNRIDDLNCELQRLTIHYQNDASMIYREQAELNFYYGFYRQAFQSAFIALRKEPFLFNNYRLIQHMLRKIIIGF